MLNTILQWDEQLTRELNNLFPHSFNFDAVFAFLSGYGSSYLIWIIILVLLIVFEEKRHKKFIWSFFSSILASSFLINFVLKNLFSRPRPTDLMTSFNYLCPSDFSFPSGHAAVSFSAAYILSKYDPKRAKIYYTIAVLVSLSRIYLGCHFLLDILVGGLIGLLIGKVAYAKIK